MASEKQVQAAIVEALLWDGWLILRINQGGRHEQYNDLGGIQRKRYIRFAFWQILGMDAQDSGFSDVIAMKVVRAEDEIISVTGPMILAVECKAPGKKKNVTAKQQAFLDAITEHGGIAIVADCLKDIEPYLDRVEAQ